MRIHHWEIKDQKEVREVSAQIDDFRLWYRLPTTYSISTAGDPFVAAALLPAMAKGETLELDPGLTVSPRLLKNLAVFQDVHHCWNPELKIVRIEAVTAPTVPLNDGPWPSFRGAWTVCSRS